MTSKYDDITWKKDNNIWQKNKVVSSMKTINLPKITLMRNNSVVIQKSKGSLKNNKFVYFDMYILELSRVLTRFNH